MTTGRALLEHGNFQQVRENVDVFESGSAEQRM